MKKAFLVIYAVIIATVTVLFMIFGERRDPRFYVTLLILAIAGKVVSKWIDDRT